MRILWDRFLDEFNIKSATLLSQSELDSGRRVYLAEEHVYKVVAFQLEKTRDLRAHNLVGEFSILKSCDGISGVPQAIALYNTSEFEVLVLQWFPGNPLANLSVTWVQMFKILIKLGFLILRLSWRGISQNDIVSRNILVDSDNSICLIDFDQASRCTFFGGVLRQFFGINIGGSEVKSSLVSLIKAHLKNNLSHRTVFALKRFRDFISRKKNHRLPIVAKDASAKSRMLLKAWKMAQKSDANSPGQYLAYYSLSNEGYYFPGERSWIERWDVLRSITDFSGKRILELGCNVALLSIYLLKYENAESALAVDVDRKIIEAAKQVGLAFGVKPLLRVQDLDSAEDWETELAAFKPDIVFALNVLNWVQDKKRLLNFLGRCQEVVFEGHDSLDIERERLQAVGFKQIDIISISERGREVLLCKKKSHSKNLD